ncbi:hypothetical protein Bbelb_434280 [Branchiostoma belcheri]|nr:hypothetical protein Bbelb_434280 [Branchiostoma belcheri]
MGYTNTAGVVTDGGGLDTDVNKWAFYTWELTVSGCVETLHNSQGLAVVRMKNVSLARVLSNQPGKSASSEPPNPQTLERTASQSHFVEVMTTLNPQQLANYFSLMPMANALLKELSKQMHNLAGSEGGLLTRVTPGLQLDYPPVEQVPFGKQQE